MDNILRDTARLFVAFYYYSKEITLSLRCVLEITSLASCFIQKYDLHLHKDAMLRIANRKIIYFNPAVSVIQKQLLSKRNLFTQCVLLEIMLVHG